MVGEEPEEIIFPSRHLGNNWPKYVMSPWLQLSTISHPPPSGDEQGWFSSIPFPRGEKFKKSQKLRLHRLSEAKPPTIFMYLCLH